MSTIDDLLDQWEENFERGILLSPEQLCAEHPELLDDVRWQIQALKAVELGFAGADQTRVVALPGMQGGEYRPENDLRISSRFKVIDFHAAGGLGKVYIAFDSVLNRKVAIKFPKKSGMTAEQAARFAQEARITGQLEHPGIVPIHALCSEPGTDPYYVMRFVDGTTLQAKIETLHHGLRSARSLAWYMQSDIRHLLQAFVNLSNIVAFAHQHQVIHRDIKPSNVMLGPFGETLLLDWGIAKSLSENLSGDALQSALEAEWMTGVTPVHTKPGRPLGTPAYASPEQLAGDIENVKEASDIFSLGATLFCILSGKAPIDFVGLNKYLELLQNPNTDLTQYLPLGVPKRLRAICKHALSVSPGARYVNAVELANDIDRYLAREPISVMKDAFWERGLRIMRRHPVVSTGVIASSFLLASAAAVTSYLVSSKNVELAGMVDTLNDANSITMRSLRTMVDEIVFTRFAEGGAVSEEERDYIENVRRNYADLASVGSNELQSDAIHGEAELQLGRIYTLLGNDALAVEHLNVAIDKLTTAVNRNEDAAALQGLLLTYEALGSHFELHGDCAKSLKAAESGLAVIQQITLNASSLSRSLDPHLHGKLRRLRANALVQVHEWDSAIEEYRVAIKQLEQKIEVLEADEQARVIALSECYSGLAILLMEGSHSAKNASECRKLADAAVQQMESLPEANRERPRLQLSLARILHNRSRIRERQNELHNAIYDMHYAESMISRLYERYQSITIYRDFLSAILERIAMLAKQENDESRCYYAVRKMTDFPTMTRHEVTVAIEMMEWKLSRENENGHVSDLDTEEHLARVAQLQASFLREDGDFAAALAITERAIELLEKMTELHPNRTTWQYRLVTCWLDKLDAELMDSQNTVFRQTLRTAQGLFDRLEASGQADALLGQRIDGLRELVSNKKVRSGRTID